MTRRLSFAAVAWKNVRRRPSRSLLTIVGVAVAVAAVVTLLTVMWGFERAWLTGYQVRAADLIVTRISSRRPLPSPFSASMLPHVRGLPDVEQAAGTLTDFLSIEEAPAILVSGWDAGTFLWNHLTLLEGRWPAAVGERSVALGAAAAEILGKSVGDLVRIDTFEFRVCGLFSSPSVAENGTVLMTLPQIQEITSREGLVSTINIKLKPLAGPAGVDRVRQAVRAKYPAFSVFSVAEVVERNLALQVGKAVTLAVSVVTLAVGTVGVLNTMLMSIFERLQEIAILLAMGWRRWRVMWLILLESLVLSAAGGLAGVAAGVGALAALQSADWFRGRMDATPTLPMLLAVLGATLVAGVAAGLYPAWIGARTRPAEGLRHE